ncbi:MAG: cell division protein ZapA [Methylococcaceae bacterium]|nr:cell division protein ZapA [Methylococcaceae bacterium]
MRDPITPVSIQVLGKEYRIACADEERDDLLESARYLDQKMREIRDTGRVVGLDRIAVMAALNIANELAQSNRKNNASSRELCDRLVRIQERIGAVLDPKASE